MPEADLVNELLEDHASDNVPTDRETDDASVPDELRDTPAFSAPEGDFFPWQNLRDTASPVPLPYDQRLDAVRTYLGGLGTGRYEVLRAFRKEVAYHHLTHAERYPLDEEICREFLGLSIDEYNILTTANPSGLADLFGFPATVTDTEALAELQTLPAFLDHTGLGLEEFRALFGDQGQAAIVPDWIAISTDPPPDSWHCELPDVEVRFGAGEGESIAILARLHRYLRLRRYLRATLADGLDAEDEWRRAKAVSLALDHYTRPDEAQPWTINAVFLCELASLQHLCGELDGWIWHSTDSDHGGLSFAAADVDEQRRRLAAEISLETDPAANVSAWTELETLCGVGLEAPRSETRIRRALRLAQLAKKIKHGTPIGSPPYEPSTERLSVGQMRYLFWEQDQHARLVADPGQGFADLNSAFAAEPAQEEIDDPKQALLDLLEKMGFPQTDIDLIEASLESIIDRPTAGERRYQVPLADAILTDRLREKLEDGDFAPFDIGDDLLFINRPATEEETIKLLAWITRRVPDADVNKPTILGAVADLSWLPLGKGDAGSPDRKGLAHLRPLLANQRDARNRLIETRILLDDTDDEKARKEREKWLFVHRTVKQLTEVLLDHFEQAVEAGQIEPDGQHEAEHNRDVAERLLFRELQPFSAVGDFEADELLLPELAWRDLILPRGSGLRAAFWEYEANENEVPPEEENPAAEPPHSRIDADTLFAQEPLGDDADGAPFGWQRNTPEPAKLPESHLFPGQAIGFPTGLGSDTPWRVAWSGRIYIPTDEIETLYLHLAINLDPLIDNGALIFLENNDGDMVPVIEDWDPPDSHALERSAALAVTPGRFYKLEIRFYDNASASTRESKFSLSWVISPSSDQPALGAYRESGEVFFRSPVADPDRVWNLEHFNDAYRRTWKACFYAGALGLIPDEISFFTNQGDEATRGRAFGGSDQTFGDAEQPIVQPFDLNDLHPVPAPEARRRAFFDQWENLIDYVALRHLVDPGEGGATDETDLERIFARLREIFLAAYQDDGSWDTAPAEVATIRTGTGWDTQEEALLDECVEYHETDPDPDANYRLVRRDLRNEVWLLRVYRAVQLLRHRSPWFGEGDRLTGDLLRRIATDPIPSAEVAHDVRALFGAEHHDGETCAACGIVREMNDALRLRAREALLAYLSLERAGVVAEGRSPSQWSRHLLIDVECDLESRLTRVESAVATIQRLATDRLAAKPDEAAASAAWAEIATYLLWHGWKARQLWPENVVAFRGHLEKSAAFRQLERSLRDDRLSLRGDDGWPTPESLPLLRDQALLSSEFSDSLAGRTEQVEPHTGWLSPVRANVAANEGWQPGADDMRGSTLFEDTEHGRHYLFWVVPAAPFEDRQSTQPDYTPPDQNGAVTAAVEVRDSVRLGWSHKLKDADHWEASQLSDDWVAVPDPHNVALAPSVSGDQIQVACGGGQGFTIARVTGRSGTSRPPADSRQSGSVAFPEATSYGGLTQLPPSYAAFATPLESGFFEPGENEDEIPPFGLSQREKLYDVPLSVAEELGDASAYRDAKQWLDLGKAISPENYDLHWDDNSGNRARDLILRQVELQLDWADALLRQNTEEGLRKSAALLHNLAIYLGERPRSIDGNPAPREALSTIATNAGDHFGDSLNPRLLNLWNRLEQRLAQVTAHRNAAGQHLPRPAAGSNAFFTTPFNPPGVELRSPYRFSYLLQKAKDFVAELKGLGGALLGAIEKGEGEHLTALRTAHEGQIALLSRDIRRAQWEEAETQWRILRQNRFNTEFRKRFYEELINGGRSSGERSHLNLLEVAEDLTLAAQVLELAAQVISLFPDLTAGGAGISSPVAISKLTGGEKISRMMEFAGRALHTISGKTQSDASQTLTEAGYDRRHREWVNQRDAAKHEITWLERQIDAAHQRMRIAESELNSQQMQLENSRRIAEFLRDKFSNSEFQDWMVRETRSLYRQTYDLAVELCRQTEQAFRYERHFTRRTFIGATEAALDWDGDREGALAAEQLQLALRRMERAYDDENLRESELSIHVSLRKHFGRALVSLRTAGVCEIEIPEWFYDLSHPGHYMRRIKSATVSIPCALAPYQTVNAKVTLLSSKVRTAASPGGDYPEVPGGQDARFVHTIGAANSIDTSGAQNDSGVFELNLKDERYLPFEGAGAISRWRIELPAHSNRELDFTSLSDVVLHLRYTSRDAGAPLQTAAIEEATRHLPTPERPGSRLIHLRHDFPSEWSKVEQFDFGGGAPCEFCLDLTTKNLFPWTSAATGILTPRVEIVALASAEFPESIERLQGAIARQPALGEPETFWFYRDRQFPNHFRAVLGEIEQSASKWTVTLTGTNSDLEPTAFDRWPAAPQELFFNIEYFPNP